MGANPLSFERTPIGVWTELPKGSRWSNEGIPRVLGFLIEGAAQTGRNAFHLIVTHSLAENVREDLRSLTAREHVDWEVVEGPSFRDQQADETVDQHHDAMMVDLARFANAHMDVAAWIVAFPFFEASLLLDRPRAILFPDAIPYDFPLGWPLGWEEDGLWPSWLQKSKAVMADAHAVITFSKHVAQRHVLQLCAVPSAKLHIIPLAPPDLSPALSLFKADLLQESRARAAKVLRRYSAERHWRYLSSFAFEDADYAVVSTQDRPTKNIAFAARAAIDLIRRDHRHLKLITTAAIHYGMNYTNFPALVEKAQAPLDILSMRDLPRNVHAALYYCAKITVHPSFFEGIIGALPFYESVSLGTPAIIARGPHTSELLDAYPDLRPFTFDPYDLASLKSLMLAVLDDRDGAMERLRPIYERMRQRNWGQVADEYANAALGGAPGEMFDDNTRTIHEH